MPTYICKNRTEKQCAQLAIVHHHTIKKLRQTFSSHGFPNIILSDNGISLTGWKIRHTIILKLFIPLFIVQAIDWLREWYKQSHHWRRWKVISKTIYIKINTDNTPFYDGRSPVVLLMKRIVRGHLSSISPNFRENVMNKQSVQLNNQNKSAKHRLFFDRDNVYAVNLASSTKWLKWLLQDKLGPVSFTVLLEDIIKLVIPYDSPKFRQNIWIHK